MENNQPNSENTTEKPESQAVNDQPSSTRPDEDQLKIVSAVGYLGILFLLPYLMFPKEKFAVFHANQGLVLLITGFAGGTLLSILSPLLAISLIGLVLYPAFWLAMVVLLVIGVVNAYGGKMKRLPVIGGLDILKVK